MKNYCLFAALCLFLSAFAPVSAQTPFCGSSVFWQNAFSSDSVLSEKWLLQNDAAHKFFQENSQPDGAASIVTLPVVVHLMHNNGPENLSDTEVQQAVQRLNDAYANAGFYDQGSGADVQIRFCLATRAPDGSASTGINRVLTPLTTLNLETDDWQLKDLIDWDPTRYINIWVVRSICSTAWGCGVYGYATQPAFHGSAVDGIVLEAAYFSGAPTNSSAAAHEMGHYLGLYHTFEGGCTNNDCLSDGDHVCDTPPDQSTAALPCDQSANTCSTDTQSGLGTDLPDDTKNFMDYGNLACLNDFTPGQAGRMNFFVQNARQSLLASDGCAPPCPNLVAAAFTPGALVADLGSTLSFGNQSQNAASYSWTVNGIPFSSDASPSYVFDQTGVFTVVLTAVSADPALCPSQTASAVVQVICPARADFLLSDLEVFTGGSVTLTNTSQGATQFAWTLNGVSQGANLTTLNFPEAGSYSITLEAGNGACTTSKTLIVTVQDSCKGQSFQKTFGTAEDERGVASILLNDGNYLVGGDGDVPGAGREVLFIKTDADGNVLWTKRFGGIGSNEYLQYLTPKTDGGFLALLSSDNWNSASEASLAAFSTSGDLLWQRKLTSPGGSELRRIHPTADGGYIACGFVRANAFDTLASVYFLKLDAIGNQEWASYYSLSGQSVYATDVTGAGDTAYVCSGYSHQPGGLRQILIMQLNTDGSLKGAYKISPQGSDQILWNVATIATGFGISFTFSGSEKGYSALGKSTGIVFNTGPPFQTGTDNHYEIEGYNTGFHDLLVPRGSDLIMASNALEANDTSSALMYFSDFAIGNSWAQGYPGNGNSKIAQVSASDENGYLFTGSTIADTDRDIYWIKTGSTGIAGDCANQPFSFSVSSASPTLNLLNVPLSSGTVWPWENAGGLTVQPYDLTPVLLCPSACANLPCKTVWTQTFSGQTGFFTLSAIVAAPDGSFYAGGTRGNRTILINFSPDGALLWSRQFHFSTRNDRLIDMTIDSDGNLIGVGNAEQATIVFAGFTFKYDPVANVVLWAHEESESKLSHFTNIEEIAPNGNYLLNGIYPTGTSSSDTDFDPVLLELDRNTGNLTTSGFVHAYDLNKNEEFLAIRQHNGAFFAVGKTETSAMPSNTRTPVLIKFDLSGNILWCRKFLIPSTATPYLESSDIVFDGDSMVISIHGRFDTLPGILTSQFALTKIAPDGNVLWSRIYTIYDGNSSSGSTYVQNLSTTTDGYLVLTRELLIKTNKNGELRWARHTFGRHDSGRRMLLEKDGSVYVVGKAFNQAAALFLARYQSSNGDAGSSCGLDYGLQVSYDNLPGVSTLPFDLLSYDNPLLLQTNNVVPEDIQLGAPSYPCGSPCAEICNNGVSDDYDSLIDCLDPKCDCPDCHGERARIWYFGQHAGLDFATDPPTILTDGATDTPGATAVACDGGGRLVFYSDGENIYNRHHELMPNGTGLTGGSVSLGKIAVPLRSSVFGLLYTDEVNPFLQSYSVIDMSKNYGLGGFFDSNGPVYKNFSVNTSASSEKIAVRQVCGNSNGSWLVAKNRNTDMFEVNGFSYTSPNLPAVLFQYGAALGSPGIDLNGDNNSGQMKFNHAGTQLANALPGTGGFDLFTFDPANGSMSYVLTVTLPELGGAYGLEFSPDDRFLYLSTSLRLYQFDLSAGDAAAIAGSRVLLTAHPAPRFGALQLGPNGKIYIANGAGTPSPALDVIFYPNEPGAACQYQANAQSLGAGKVYYGLPNFPSEFVWPQRFVKISGPDSLCGVPAQASWTLNQPFCHGADSVRWSMTGNIGSVINGDVYFAQIELPGTYQLIATAWFDCGIVSSDTLDIVVSPDQAPSLYLGPDLKLCENGVFSLQATPGFAAYHWQDGSTNAALTTSFPGKYWVSARDACGNVQTDTINVSVDPGTQLDLGPNRVACREAGTTFELPGAFTSWQWSPAAALDCNNCSNVTVHPFSAINYVVVAQNQDGCLSTDTVRVSPQTLTVMLDTTVCAGLPFAFLDTLLPGVDTLLSLDLVTADGCDLELTANISTWPAVQVTLPPDTTLKIGALLPLTPSVNGAGPFVYNWSPPDWLSCTACPDAVAEAHQDVRYTLQVTDANGCAAIDSIHLHVLDECAVRAPTAFTPDNDGTNDLFNLLADPCVRSVRSLRIYSRWGQEVFTGVNLPPNDPGFAWDGRSKGREQPMDVYVWTAEVLYFDGRVGSFKGEVTLLR